MSRSFQKNLSGICSMDFVFSSPHVVARVGFLNNSEWRPLPGSALAWIYKLQNKNINIIEIQL